MSTFGDRLYELGGVPVGSGTGSFPCIGDIYWVDGTNGLDSNSGLKPKAAKKTIQAAVNAQLGDPSGFGDIIYILPGTYVESVYAVTLTNVSLIGAGADLVRITPTAGHALQIGAEGSAEYSPMTNVTLKGISFHTASATNLIYAAVQTRVMRYSIIEDCKFLGASVSGYQNPGTATTIGLQIGDREGTFGSTYEISKENRISRCIFANYGGRTNELAIGILVGDIGNTTATLRGFTLTTIEACHFMCYDTGILMNTGVTSSGGTVVKNNVISSNQGGAGVNLGIVHGATTDDLLCTIADNRITAITDCIKHFKTCNVTGNMCAQGGGAPVDETWI